MSTNCSPLADLPSMPLTDLKIPYNFTGCKVRVTLNKRIFLYFDSCKKGEKSLQFFDQNSFCREVALLLGKERMAKLLRRHQLNLLPPLIYNSFVQENGFIDVMFSDV